METVRMAKFEQRQDQFLVETTFQAAFTSPQSSWLSSRAKRGCCALIICTLFMIMSIFIVTIISNKTQQQKQEQQDMAAKTTEQPTAQPPVTNIDSPIDETDEGRGEDEKDGPFEKSILDASTGQIVTKNVDQLELFTSDKSYDCSILEKDELRYCQTNFEESTVSISREDSQIIIKSIPSLMIVTTSGDVAAEFCFSSARIACKDYMPHDQQLLETVVAARDAVTCTSEIGSRIMRISCAVQITRLQREFRSMFSDPNGFNLTAMIPYICPKMNTTLFVQATGLKKGNDGIIMSEINVDKSDYRAIDHAYKWMRGQLHSFCPSHNMDYGMMMVTTDEP